MHDVATSTHPIRGNGKPKMVKREGCTTEAGEGMRKVTSESGSEGIPTLRQTNKKPIGTIATRMLGLVRYQCQRPQPLI